MARKTEPSSTNVPPAKPPPRAVAETLTPIRFSTYLEASALELGKGKRGERSRLKLLAAGTRLLDGSTYADLKIEDVCVEAGVAKGTFYIYFGSKDEFLRELAQTYCAFELNTLPRGGSRLSRFTSVRKWIGWYERTFASNVGILRSMVQMGAHDATMRAHWQSRNGALVQALLSEAAPPYALTAEDRDLLLWALRTIGGMLDQSLFDRHSVQTPSGLEDPVDLELVVEMHAVFAYRALRGQDPPLEELQHPHVLKRLDGIFSR